MLILFYRKYVDQLEEINNKSRRAYTQTADILEKFECDTKQKLTFRSMNKIFYNDFWEFMVEKNGYSPNYFGKHIKNIRSFLKWAERHKLHQNDSYRGFRIINRVSEEDVLNSTELKKIWSIDLRDQRKIVSSIQDYERTRLDGRQYNTRYLTLLRNFDIVMAMASSGCYPNDLRKLSKENVIGNRYIKYLRFKSVNSFKEPFCIFSYQDDNIFHFREVFERQNYKFRIDLKSLYRDMKIILELAGIKKSVTARSFRKSFVSIWYFERGLDLQTCMKMTGHSRETSFKHYLNIDDDIVINRIMEHNPMRELINFDRDSGGFNCKIKSRVSRAQA